MIDLQEAAIINIPHMLMCNGEHEYDEEKWKEF